MCVCVCVCVCACACACVFPRPYKMSVKTRTNNFTKHNNMFVKRSTNTNRSRKHIAGLNASLIL